MMVESGLGPRVEPERPEKLEYRARRSVPPARGNPPVSVTGIRRGEKPKSRAPGPEGPDSPASTVVSPAATSVRALNDSDSRRSAGRAASPATIAVPFADACDCAKARSNTTSFTNLPLCRARAMLLFAIPTDSTGAQPELFAY